MVAGVGLDHGRRPRRLALDAWLRHATPSRSPSSCSCRLPGHDISSRSPPPGSGRAWQPSFRYQPSAEPQPVLDAYGCIADNSCNRPGRSERTGSNAPDRHLCVVRPGAMGCPSGSGRRRSARLRCRRRSGGAGDGHALRRACGRRRGRERAQQRPLGPPPWPWTINAAGQGSCSQARPTPSAAVLSLMARAIR